MPADSTHGTRGDTGFFNEKNMRFIMFLLLNSDEIRLMKSKKQPPSPQDCSSAPEMFAVRISDIFSWVFLLV